MTRNSQAKDIRIPSNREKKYIRDAKKNNLASVEATPRKTISTENYAKHLIYFRLSHTTFLSLLQRTRDKIMAPSHLCNVSNSNIQSRVNGNGISTITRNW